MTDDCDDPFDLFGRWFDEASAREPDDANAMALATADAQGAPSLRMVLLKGWGPDGFVFFTNLDSRKGEQLSANDRAALLFHWKSLKRQIRIEGRAETVSETEADAYFATRARDSQLGAWASDQSRPLENRSVFMARIASFAARFGVAQVPRPPHWSGYRIIPERMEFWRDQPFRLHERRLFTPGDTGWRMTLLYP